MSFQQVSEDIYLCSLFNSDTKKVIKQWFSTMGCLGRISYVKFIIHAISIKIKSFDMLTLIRVGSLAKL